MKVPCGGLLSTETSGEWINRHCDDLLQNISHFITRQDTRLHLIVREPDDENWAIGTSHGGANSANVFL